MKNLKKYLTQKAGLSEEEYTSLSSSLSTKKVLKGDLILSPGEVCKYAFFVESGLIRSYTLDEIGKEHIIQLAPEMWIVSDRSGTYFNEPAEFFVQAIEDSEVVFMDVDFLSKASELSISFRKFNDRALHAHIRQLQKRVNSLLSATAEKRYLDFIQTYPDINQRVPQWMIASYLGITPESLSRVRKELVKKK
jgi:CRP-like cAMP-binding protein